MNRHQIRQVILYGVYLVEFYDTQELPDAFSQILSDALIFEDMEIGVPGEADVQFMQARFQDFLAHRDEVDAHIRGKVTDWKIERMGKVELAILRLAVYEIFFDSDVPQKVAINEAVILAKEFGQENSGSFVNGALSCVIKKEKG